MELANAETKFAKDRLSRHKKEAEQHRLARSYKPLQIVVPIEEAIEICNTIRSQFTKWYSYKKWRCAACVLFGSNNIPLKLKTDASPYCGCENVARRYAHAVQYVYTEHSRKLDE